MFVTTLKDLLRSSKAVDLRARSFEGDIYLLEVAVEDDSDYLSDTSDAQPMRFRSYSSTKDFVRSLAQADVPVRLVHQSPYEEMIGLPR
jgi:hypothetical protein